MTDQPISSKLNLAPYSGRWVALVGDQVAGVGHTAPAAAQLARRNRPKEKFQLHFVEAEGGDVLPLSPLLARLRPYLEQLDVPVYLVGGAVRDALLGRTSHDLDFVVPDRAIHTSFKLADALGVPAYPLDKERDTGRVMLPNENDSLDFARFRGDDLEADLRDRDFTINAIALPAAALTTASLVDPCHGYADLKAKLIRQTHEKAIANDPIRALRAIRQAVQLGFTIETETAKEVVAASPQLPQSSPERVRDELLKLLQTPHPDQALQLLQDHFLLAVVWPEIAALVGVEQSTPHHEDVFQHTVSVLRWLKGVEAAAFHKPPSSDPLWQQINKGLSTYSTQLKGHLNRPLDGGLNGWLMLRLGALFHDVGKAPTQTIEEGGRIRFLAHDKIGARMASARLRQQRLSNEAIKHVQNIVAGHMRPLHLLNTDSPSRRAIYRYFRTTQTAGLDIGLLTLADHLATYNGPGPDGTWRRLLALVRWFYEHYFQTYEQTVAPVPLLDGNDLIKAFALPPGPEIGRLLRLLHEAQAVGEVTTHQQALDFIQTHL